eukprot:7393503-Pyramimonas_sp.AAC.1
MIMRSSGPYSRTTPINIRIVRAKTRSHSEPRAREVAPNARSRPDSLRPTCTHTASCTIKDSLHGKE